MHASSNFVLLMKGPKKDREAALKYLNKCFDDHVEDTYKIIAEETYEVVWLEDLVDMFKKMIKKCPQVEFAVMGYVDCSENSGEFMDFGLIYQDETLTIHNSDWVGYDDEDDDCGRENLFATHQEIDVVDIDDAFDELCSDIKEKEWSEIDVIECGE